MNKVVLMKKLDINFYRLLMPFGKNALTLIVGQGIFAVEHALCIWRLGKQIRYN